MNVRTRGARLALAAVTACAGAAVIAAPAAAAPAVPAAAPAGDGMPGFLEPAQLPPHPTSEWIAGPITSGQPDPLPLCVGDALPSTSFHRVYRTDRDTGALQVTVVGRDRQWATDFAALLREDLDRCARNLQAADPDVTASRTSYGRLDVEEGAYVYGLHTETTWGASDINLFSVGRDGNVVTLVQWREMGGFPVAPVAAFKRTTVQAVEGLR